MRKMKLTPKYSVILALTNILLPLHLIAQDSYFDRNMIDSKKSTRKSYKIPEGYIKVYHDYTWIIAENPNPEINMNILKTGNYAGDINGDGKIDLVISGYARDERTIELSDEVGKSFIFFGNNTTAMAYDQLIYDYLIPIGDINGDGFDDAVSINEDGNFYYLGSTLGYSKSEVQTNGLDTEVMGFSDFDGDNYEDYVTWDSRTDMIHITWGAAELSQMALTSINLPNRDWINVTIGDIDENGCDELVTFTGDDPNGYISIYSHNEMRSETLLQTIPVEETPLNASKMDIYLTDWNGDTHKEIYITNRKTYLFISDDSNALQFQSNPMYMYEHTFPNYPIQDIDNDGNTDFLHINSLAVTPGYSFYHGTIEFGNTHYLLDGILNVPIENGYSVNKINNRYGGFGDYNGDGIADYIMKVSNESSVIRRFIFGDSTRDFEINGAVYIRDDFSDRVYSTSNLGDFNGDNVDDFAIIHHDRDYISVFYGATDFKQEPDLRFECMEAKEPSSIAAGDFNSDGFNDLAICYSAGDSRIEFYFGSESMDVNADHIIRFLDVEPGIQYTSVGRGIQNVCSLNDVNDDGFDDLIYNIPNASELGIYIIFGNSILSSTYDIKIDPTDNPITSQSHFTALGDVNDDDIDDFLISDHNWGGGHLFFGNQDLIFHNQDLIFEPDTIPYASFPHAAAGNGDFNGDGNKDIAILPFYNIENGPAYLYIYYGGSDIDVQPDLLLDIPPDAFGAEEGGLNGVLNNIGILSFVQDIDNDGADELFIGSDFRSTNAILYLGGEAPDTHPAIVFIAPNQDDGLGGDCNDVYEQQKNVAIGDFDGDGYINFILAQTHDDNDLANSSRIYDFEIGEDIVGIKDSNHNGPEQFDLQQNYPNPFNPVTTIKFKIVQTCNVKLNIYDIIGRNIAELIDGEYAPGEHKVTFDAGGIPSGLYFYQLRTDEFTDTKKMILME